ncbi:hypothetical protein EDB83DRAFT_2309316 [Lactarius deliciosus]|nr:hypothetical protein EDB83DRAFT_2309316 [Lactarius deliciosus]
MHRPGLVKVASAESSVEVIPQFALMQHPLPLPENQTLICYGYLPPNYHRPRQQCKSRTLNVLRVLLAENKMLLEARNLWNLTIVQTPLLGDENTPLPSILTIGMGASAKRWDEEQRRAAFNRSSYIQFHFSNLSHSLVSGFSGLTGLPALQFPEGEVPEYIRNLERLDIMVLGNMLLTSTDGSSVVLRPLFLIDGSCSGPVILLSDRTWCHPSERWFQHALIPPDYHLGPFQHSKGVQQAHCLIALLIWRHIPDHDYNEAITKATMTDNYDGHWGDYDGRLRRGDGDGDGDGNKAATTAMVMG